jgi:hypothetical protein
MTTTAEWDQLDQLAYALARLIFERQCLITRAEAEDVLAMNGVKGLPVEAVIERAVYLGIVLEREGTLVIPLTPGDEHAPTALWPQRSEYQR